MTAPSSLTASPSILLRSFTHVNRSQWRAFHRHLSSRTLRRPTTPPSTTRNLLPNHRTASSAAHAAPSNKLRNLLYGSGLLLTLSLAYLYTTDTRASLHQYLLVPTLRLLHADPEEAHHAGVRYLKTLYDFSLHTRERSREDEILQDLQVEVFGHVLRNPVGTSAGIDKDAEIPGPLFALGPAVVEVGGVTPRPQGGNAKPRVFRIPSQNALINRYGLNSEGAEHVAMRLRERVRQYAYENGLGLEEESERLVLDGEAGVPPGSLMSGRILAVQIAKNKDTPDGDLDAVARDYTYCVDHLARYADVLVVNVSSPNTPGLRDLQATAPLTSILGAVVKSAKACDRKTKPAVMVKVSPDEDTDAQIEGICTAVWASGVDGVIVGNTTKKRPDPIPQGYKIPADEAKLLTETGGYSGPQMFSRTLNLVQRYRAKLDQGPAEEEATTPPQPAAKIENPAATPPEQDTLTPSAPAAVQHLTATTSLSPAERAHHDAANLKPLTPTADAASTQPTLKLPERHTSHSASPSAPAHTPAAPDSAPPSPGQPEKVIFATGGVATGEQCLQLLNAGASVCQVYTAMMYGGAGTVTRIKGEMRGEIARQEGERRRK